MVLGEVGLGDADGGPVMAGDTQVAGEGLQQFDLVGQDQRLDAAVRLEVDALAVGAQTGELGHRKPLDLVAADELARPFRGFGFVHAQDDLGAGRAGEGDAAFAAIDGLELGNVLQAEHDGKPALAPAGEQLFNLWLVSE